MPWESQEEVLEFAEDLGEDNEGICFHCGDVLALEPGGFVLSGGYPVHLECNDDEE